MLATNAPEARDRAGGSEVRYGVPDVDLRVDAREALLREGREGVRASR